MKDFPYSTPATGWFQVAWDHELSPGDVRQLHYFGQDLVCYRTASGDVKVLDAYCGHLGANLAVGGTVSGENILCPFHGWAWDGQGRNTNIPYSERPVKVCIRHYPVRLANGAVMVWWDPNSAEPTWEPPKLPEFDNAEYYPANPYGLRKWTNLAFPPQVVAENTVDPTHFQYVHRAPRSTVIEKFETKGEYAYVMHDYAYGKHGTDLTPEGTVDGQLEIEAWGLGIIAFRMKVYVEAVQMFCVTPVDEKVSDIHFSVWLRKGAPDSPEPTPTEQRVIDEQFRQVAMDFPIWENMRYVVKAPIVREESPTYQNFRKWSRQFYLPTEGPLQNA
ncbi:MAG TPA: Rieske 2Fe-2S domain-containing protein [Pseudonocardia sp.]|nr:Rieske 2Fe-2S domain-containing protein [Pseudonocardia sp.]